MEKIVDICDREINRPKTGSQFTLNNVNMSLKKTIFSIKRNETFK